MKIACAQALAKLARADVPDEVAAAYGKRLKYGPGYIIPTPFDPRLISEIPPAVAKAAAETGVARKPIEDLFAYKQALAARTDPKAPKDKNIQGVDDAHDLVEKIEDKMITIANVVRGMDKRMSYNLRLMGSIIMPSHEQLD